MHAYADAGRLDTAIASLTKNATQAKQNANDSVTRIRTAEDYYQIPARTVIQNAIQHMNDAQILTLAKLMEPNLKSRPQPLQDGLKVVDPKSQRLQGVANKARLFIREWSGMDDMTSANEKQWNDAIAKAITVH